MIVIAGTITFDPDKAEQMLASAITLMEATRAEVGCLDYVMTADEAKEYGFIDEVIDQRDLLDNSGPIAAVK